MLLNLFIFEFQQKNEFDFIQNWVCVKIAAFHIFLFLFFLLLFILTVLTALPKTTLIVKNQNILNATNGYYSYKKNSQIIIEKQINSLLLSEIVKYFFS